MRLIANELFRLQALASASLVSTTSRESALCNANRPDLPTFELGSMVLFYHHWPGGRSHKLATTWSGPYQVIHRRFNEYSIAAVDTGVVVNRVHCQFLRAYSPPVKRLKGALLGIGCVTPQRGLQVNLLPPVRLVLLVNRHPPLWPMEPRLIPRTKTFGMPILLLTADPPCDPSSGLSASPKDKDATNPPWRSTCTRIPLNPLNITSM